MPTGNYQFIVNSSFKPFSMQEMLVPFTTYKQAYDSAEQAYADISNQADTFKYLSETLPEDSAARQLYEGYANTLHSAGEDFARNGLTMANRRTLTDLKRRYAGEIGRLQKADADMQQEMALRRQMSAQDPTMLYANDNLNIDNFLDRKKPDLYGVSGNNLYKLGAQAAQSYSSRIYQKSDIKDLNKYYQEVIQRVGYDPKLLNEWRTNLEAIPEFNKAVEDILKAQGVTAHLTGVNYERARQNVINGIMDGAIYKESRNTVQNQGVMTRAQEESLNLQATNAGMVRDASAPNGWKWSKDIDPAFRKAKVVAEIKSENNKGKNGTQHPTISSSPVKVEWTHNNPAYAGEGQKNYSQYYNEDGSEKKGSVVSSYAKEDDIKGSPISWENMPEWMRVQAKKIIQDGDPTYYDFFYSPYRTAVTLNPLAPGHPWFNDDEATLYIVPRKMTTNTKGSSGINPYDLIGTEETEETE